MQTASGAALGGRRAGPAPLACSAAAAAASPHAHRAPLSPAPLPPAGSVSVSFQLPYHCKYGQKLCLIGSQEFLGGWRVEQAVPMNWREGDVWEVELSLPAS